MLHSSELGQKPIGKEEGNYDGYPIRKNEWQKKTAKTQEGSGSVTKILDKFVLFFLKSESLIGKLALGHLVVENTNCLSLPKRGAQDSLCSPHGPLKVCLVPKATKSSRE
jgi:hypothetical protein